MGLALIELVPLVIGSIAMPSWALLVLALLGVSHGRVKAAALVGGVTFVRLVQGIVFGTLLSAYELSQWFNRPGLIVSAVLIVLGVLMWVMALRQLLKNDDLKLASIVSALTPLRALGLGALLAVTSSRAWIFTLAALGVIEQANLTIAQNIIAYLLYVIGAEVLLVAPILVSTRSSKWVEAMAHWLERYNRPIVGVVSAAVGCYFLWLGISGIMR